MRVKCLAQEHNAAPRPGLKPGPPDPESRALTIRPPRLPQSSRLQCTICHSFTDRGIVPIVCPIALSKESKLFILDLARAATRPNCSGQKSAKLHCLLTI